MNKTQKKKKNNSKDIRKEIIEQYGISFNNIEEVKLSSGREYFKFVDPKTRQVRMLENVNYDTNMEIQFKSIQHELTYTQSKDKDKNAEQIFDGISKSVNELNFISVFELRDRRYKYMKQINCLSAVDRKKLKTLLEYNKQLNLKYINIENAIALNENNEVIDVEFDYAKNKAIIRSAEIKKYNYNKEYEDFKVELDNSDYDKFIDGLNIDDHDITILDTKEIKVNGEIIDKEFLINCYNMPELLAKADISDERREIIMGLIDAIKRKQKAKKISLKHEKQKLLIKKDNHKAA